MTLVLYVYLKLGVDLRLLKYHRVQCMAAACPNPNPLHVTTQVKGLCSMPRPVICFLGTARLLTASVNAILLA